MKHKTGILQVVHMFKTQASS